MFQLERLAKGRQLSGFGLNDGFGLLPRLRELRLKGGQPAVKFRRFPLDRLLLLLKRFLQFLRPVLLILFAMAMSWRKL